MAIIRKTQDSVDGLPTVLSGFTTSIDDHNTAISLLNADSDTAGSVAHSVQQVIGAAPEALDTLQEIADALANDPDLDQTLRTLITNDIATAKSEIEGSVSEAYDTLAEIETRFTALDNANDTTVGSLAKTLKDSKDYTDTSVSGLLAKSDNLASLTDAAAARTNLDVYSKSEADALAGATIKGETITVTANDTIVLAESPVDGVILNFNAVRNIDGGVSTDIPVVIDGSDGTGKTFTLQGDNVGDFDGLDVQVQYIY